MPSFQVTVDISGPVFDGRAEQDVNKVLEATARTLAIEGRAVIAAQALTMNKSGRAGTGPGGFGAAAGAVVAYDNWSASGNWVIYGGMKEYYFWWPWLEGTSKRNDSTRFKGYHTFREEAGRLNRRAEAVAEAELDKYIGDMGGES